jgi:hypothetical protein
MSHAHILPFAHARDAALTMKMCVWPCVKFPSSYLSYFIIQLMTPREDLVVAQYGVKLEEYYQLTRYSLICIYFLYLSLVPRPIPSLAFIVCKSAISLISLARQPLRRRGWRARLLTNIEYTPISKK